MFILEYKLRGKDSQFRAIDESIRTVQFVRNKCLRYWEDNQGVGQKDIYKHVTALRKEFSFFPPAYVLGLAGRERRIFTWPV